MKTGWGERRCDLRKEDVEDPDSINRHAALLGVN